MVKKLAENLLASREILSSGQMRALEAAAIASGEVTGAELMARAGATVAGQIRLRWPLPGRVCVLCGPGNNGGDGYVVARLLHQAGWRVRVMGLDNTPPPDAARMKALWLAHGPVAPLTTAELRRASAELYVDAIFGTGLTRAPDADILSLLLHLGGRDGAGSFFADRLVAIDCPSGLCLDSGVMLGWPRGDCLHAPRARLTVTFDSPRRGQVLECGPELCGELVVADIGLGKWRGPRVTGGFDVAPARLSGPAFCRGESAYAPDRDALAMLGKRLAGHKFSHGHALIVAGGVGHGSAARLSARAALRVGAGLVTLAPPQTAMAEHALPPDALMRHPVDDPEDLARLLSDQRITSVLIGPGCGVDRAAALVPVVLSDGRGAVLDADALTAMSRRPDPVAGLTGAHVLTPHQGEFARIFADLADRLGQSPGAAVFSRLDAADEAARRAGCTVLLKGADTVVAAPDGRAHVQASSYDAAAPWLATAGSGDVLAGIIAGLLARGFHGFAAARIGAALHAAAGRLAGPGLIADDLPDALPAVFRAMDL